MHSRELVDRLERAGDRAYAPPATRLKHLLRRLLDADGTGHLQQEVHLRLPFTHRELARLLSVPASQLTALLARLQRDGVIRVRRDPPDPSSTCPPCTRSTPSAATWAGR